MNPQVQMRTSDQRIWALKPVSRNKFYALVTDPRDYEGFRPVDTIVLACEFDNPVFADMLYQVMYNVMQYQIHVDGYFKKRWWQLGSLKYENHKLCEMVKPYLEKFSRSEYVTPDNVSAQGDALMTYNFTPKEDEYKPVSGFERLTFSYAQKQDDKYKYLYALALPKDKETQKIENLATVYITAFMANDAEFDEYKKAIYDCKLWLDRNRSNDRRFEYNNMDRINRFTDYLTKIR